MVFHKTKKKQRKKKRKKENGAHKHRSHFKKLRVQNIHVMFSSALITYDKQYNDQNE